jgi:hypothetical protein
MARILRIEWGMSEWLKCWVRVDKGMRARRGAEGCEAQSGCGWGCSEVCGGEDFCVVRGMKKAAWDGRPFEGVGCVK